MTAAATRRTRVVAAAIADSITIEFGHAVAGSWFPISAYSRGFDGRPFASEPGASTTCSLNITASTPACSASTAARTSAPRSRSGHSVAFSLRIITTRGGGDAARAAGRHAATPSTRRAFPS